MSQDKTIHIFVAITKTDRRELVFNQDRVKGQVIKEAAGLPLDTDLFAIEHGKFKPVANDETVTIKNGDHFSVIPHGAIQYTVNDEPQWTIEKQLTPVKIMGEAGIDSAANYLILLKGNDQESFKDKPEEPIHMHNGMKFITNFMGPKPVSAR